MIPIEASDAVYRMALAGRVELDQMLFGGLPDITLKYHVLSKFNVSNPKGHSVTNCGVWFASGIYGRLKDILKFEVLADIDNCQFYFFGLPNRTSNMRFALKGNNHSATIFSTYPLRFYCRLVTKEAHLAVGERVHIGGGTMALDNSLLSVGAGGLWSDSVLIQGTDSHGIVDLNAMKIINDEPKQIRLMRRVWVGRGAKIMKNVVIGEGAIVATGAIVTKNVPNATAVAGAPAKIVRTAVSWARAQHTISDFEREQFARISSDVSHTDAPGKPATMMHPLKSIWLKAAAAGMFGAAIFEGISELVEGALLVSY